MPATVLRLFWSCIQRVSFVWTTLLWILVGVVGVLLCAHSLLLSKSVINISATVLSSF